MLSMQSAAIPAGSRYLAAQSALEADFRAGTIDLEWLPGRMADVSRLEAELATIHLAAHIQTAEVLSADQIAAYAELRQSA